MFFTRFFEENQYIRVFIVVDYESAGRDRLSTRRLDTVSTEHERPQTSRLDTRSSSSSFDCGSELTLERANAHMAITASTRGEMSADSIRTELSVKSTRYATNSCNSTLNNRAQRTTTQSSSTHVHNHAPCRLDTATLVMTVDTREPCTDSVVHKRFCANRLHTVAMVRGYQVSNCHLGSVSSRHGTQFCLCRVDTAHSSTLIKSTRRSFLLVTSRSVCGRSCLVDTVSSRLVLSRSHPQIRNQ